MASESLNRCYSIHGPLARTRTGRHKNTFISPAGLRRAARRCKLPFTLRLSGEPSGVWLAEGSSFQSRPAGRTWPPTLASRSRPPRRPRGRRRGSRQIPVRHDCGRPPLERLGLGAGNGLNDAKGAFGVDSVNWVSLAVSAFNLTFLQNVERSTLVAAFSRRFIESQYLDGLALSVNAPTMSMIEKNHCSSIHLRRILLPPKTTRWLSPLRATGFSGSGMSFSLISNPRSRTRFVYNSTGYRFSFFRGRALMRGRAASSSTRFASNPTVFLTL